MPPRPHPNPLALLALLVPLVGSHVAGCSNDPVFQLPCPVIATSSDRLYAAGADATLGQEVRGTFAAGRFGGHAVAVPLAGGLTLRVEVALDDAGLKPVVFLYGPRGADGAFGSCVAKGPQGSKGQVIAFAHEVPADGGGEFLVAVGTNPLSAGAGGYRVTVTCDGAGCAGAICSTQSSRGCAQATCSGGFDTDDAGCPTCACNALECGPFRKPVGGQCVCACPAVGPQVCGADGHTYHNACTAQCKGVPVANTKGPCEQVCKLPAGCGLQCDRYELESGCPICKCADACQIPASEYKPLCGSDGLTYTSPRHLACAPGVTVAYAGPCLPFCKVPSGCNLTCELGLKPAPGLGEQCFECACVEVPAACQDDGLPWCARWVGPPPAPLPTPQGAVQEAVVGVQMHLFRTFPNKCSADAAPGWKALIGAACPVAVCRKDADCGPAGEALKLTMGSAAPSATCLTKPVAQFGVCGLDGPSRNQACHAAAKCGPGGSCVKATEEPAGCRFDCACLESEGGMLYEPVCAVVGDQRRTFLNRCHAACAGSFRIEHPGVCCPDGRQSSDDVAIHYDALASVCAAAQADLVPQIHLESACPPTPAACTADTDRCCEKRP